MSYVSECIVAPYSGKYSQLSRTCVEEAVFSHELGFYPRSLIVFGYDIQIGLFRGCLVVTTCDNF